MRKISLLAVILIIGFACKKKTVTPTTAPTSNTTTPTHEVKYELVTKDNSWHNAKKNGTYKLDYTSDNGTDLSETIVLDTNSTLGIKWTKTVNIAEGSTFKYVVNEVSYTDLPTVNGINRNASIQLNVYIDGQMYTFYHGVAVTFLVAGGYHASFPKTITSPIYEKP